MLQARHTFLAAGYYDPLVTALKRLIEQHSTHHEANNLLDLGCGEGFYSRQLAQHSRNNIQFHGIDIAKYAIALAAKLQPAGHFAVASTLRLPYPENYFDLLLRVFAPSNPQEIIRVLKPGGLLMTVTPGPRHLWQLKELIYPEAKQHVENNEVGTNFILIANEGNRFVMTPEQSHRMALLQMTPFAWRATPTTQQHLENARNLAIETDFVITLTQLIH